MPKPAQRTRGSRSTLGVQGLGANLQSADEHDSFGVRAYRGYRTKGGIA